MIENLVNLRVWGDWACFTRPEMKVERVSYPVITPSAARGVFEAIFWEPQIYYLIDSIRVIKRGVWASVKRNEVQDQISIRNAQQWMSNPDKLTLIIAGAGENTSGTQRNTLALQNVEYIITAEVCLSELGKKSGQTLQKYLKEIQSRAKRGKCFHRPYLGVREFAADFDWVDDPASAFQIRLDEIGSKHSWHEQLGLMLYDVFDHDRRATGFKWTDTSTEGEYIKPSAYFFKAEIKDSILDCHPSRVQIIRRSGGN